MSLRTPRKILDSHNPVDVPSKKKTVPLQGKGASMTKCNTSLKSVEEAFESYKALETITLYDHYIRSYPELLKASDCLANCYEQESVPMIAHLAYGWMPTILNYSNNTCQEKNIFAVRGVDDYDKALKFFDEIECSPINNSWIGMSKTLHFLNPKMFPIWDSNIAEVFGVSSYKMKKKCVYKKHMEFVHSNKNECFVECLREAFKTKAGYEISEIRAVEFVLFVHGKSLKEQKMKNKKS